MNKEVIDISKRRSSIVNVTAAFLLLCGLLSAYFPVAIAAEWVWSNSLAYSHGWLVLLTALWFIGETSVNQQLTLSPPVWVSVSLATAGLVWFIAFFSGTQSIQLLACVGLIYFSLVAVFGVRSSMAFIIPVGILVFAVPIWGVLIPGLKELTIAVNSSLIHLSQRTAFIEGDLVHVSAGSFEIEGGCSGLHFLIVALCLAVVYSYSYLRTVLGGVVFISATALIAMIDNWLRVFIIILAGDLTDMKHYLVTVDHYKFGWIVFAISLMPMLLVGRYIERLERTTRVFETTNTILENASKRISKIAESTQHSTLKISLFALSVVIFPAYAYSITASGKVEGTASHTISIDTGRWVLQSKESSQDYQSPRFKNPEQEYWQIIEGDGTYVNLYINRYFRQTQEGEVIGYENVLFPGAGATRNVGRINIGQSGKVTFGIFRVLERGEERVALVGYNVGERVIADPAFVKLWTGIYALGGVLTAGAIVVQSDCAGDCGAAQHNIVFFLRENITEIVKGIQERQGVNVSE